MADDSIKEEWNMSLAYLKRIDDLLTSCTLCQIKDDMIGWYKGIYGLYKEIYPKLKEDKEDETKDEKKIAEKLIDELTTIKNNALKNGQIIRVKPFVQTELFFRQMLENRNMITPRKDLSGL